MARPRNTPSANAQLPPVNFREALRASVEAERTRVERFTEQERRYIAMALKDAGVKAKARNKEYAALLHQLAKEFAG
jgi:hypothetical protein